MYSSPLKHTPRTHPGRASAPPSRAVSGGVKLPGITVTGPGVGVSTVRTPPALPGNYRTAPRQTANPALAPRVRQAVERAFPLGPATPRYDRGWTSQVGRAFAWSAASAAAIEVGSQVEQSVSTIALSLGGAWAEPGGTPVVAPGFQYIGTATHPNFREYGTFPRTGRMGEWSSIGNLLPVPPNNWLLDIELAPIPGGTFAEPATTIVPAGYFWNRFVEDYGYLQRFGLHYFWAKAEVWQNNNPNPAEPLVSPAAFPLPLGVPLPVTLPAGYPLAEPMPQTRARPLPRPTRIPEVAVDIPFGPRPVPRVYPARPRKPGKKGKENKYYGKAGAAASVAFWLYEATDDWADWVNIIVNAIDGVPTNIANGSPTTQIKFLRDNPLAVVNIDIGEVIAQLAGWLVDEKFGAWVGEKNKQANRGISTSQRTTIDMRTNVTQHYSPAGASPGSFAADFLSAFM